MSVGSFFNFSSWGNGGEEGFQEKELLSKTPSEIAKCMIERSPETPQVEFVRTVYPIAALGRGEEKPLSRRQKRTYEATLDVLGSYRKKQKEEEALNEIPSFTSCLKDSPETIKERILKHFPDDGEFSSASVFLKTMDSQLSKLSPLEISNYQQALRLILDRHLEKNISLEILKQYGKDSGFLNELDSLSLIKKSINYDLQGVFSLLLENINDKDLLEAVFLDLQHSSFQIHSDDLQRLLDKFILNIGYNKGHWISLWCGKLRSPINCQLIAELLILNEDSYELFQRIVQNLYDNKDFKSAQNLVDLIGNSIEKQRVRQGRISVAYEQLSYLVGYWKYNVLSYSKMEFPGCSETEMM